MLQISRLTPPPSHVGRSSTPPSPPPTDSALTRLFDRLSCLHNSALQRRRPSHSKPHATIARRHRLLVAAAFAYRTPALLVSHKLIHYLLPFGLWLSDL
nr:hypothetical protein Itr_chr06CG15100 [Ipomoea trifida]GMD03914.1 hypothetical protein Iba_chr06aCG13460 [Ipomoea batatas]